MKKKSSFVKHMMDEMKPTMKKKGGFVKDMTDNLKPKLPKVKLPKKLLKS